MGPETVLVGAAVGAAATFIGLRAVRSLRRASDDQAATCADGCSACPMAEEHGFEDGLVCSSLPGDEGVNEMSKSNLAALGAVLVMSAISARPALAADTVETFDVGLSDLEIYGGFDGIGPDGLDRAVYGDLMIGAGLLPRFSAYLGTTLSANEYFADGAADVYVGVFGTPLDTDHVDLDLMLDMAVGGPGMSEFGLGPGIELNLDAVPDLGRFGGYLRVSVPFYGQTGEAVPDGQQLAFDLAFNPGLYWSLGERHQLLLEYDMAVTPARGGEEAGVDIGGVALGYNAVVAEPLELITQVYADVPQGDEPFGVGLMVGLIATLPSGRPVPVVQACPEPASPSDAPCPDATTTLGDTER